MEWRAVNMIKIFSLISIIFAQIPLPAMALSCAAPSIQSEYWYHQERGDVYALVLGFFRDIEFVQYEEAEGRSIWRATFVGHSLSGKAPFTTEVTIIDNQNPYEDWDPKGLGGALEGVTGLVFLVWTEDGYRAVTDLCSPFMFTDPADVKLAQACLTGRDCPKP